MISGGDPAFVVVCGANRSAQHLFTQFKSEDTQAREAVGKEEIPVIDVGTRDVYLYKNQGHKWEAYTREFESRAGSLVKITIHRKRIGGASMTPGDYYTLEVEADKKKWELTPPCDGEDLFSMWTSSAEEKLFRGAIAVSSGLKI